MKKLILIAIIAALIVSTTACGNSENNQDVRTTATTTETKTSDNQNEKEQVDEKSPTETLYKKGDTITIDKWEITLNSTEVTDRINDKNSDILYFSPDEGSKYLVVNLTVKNLSKNSETFLPAMYMNSDTKATVHYQEYEFNSTNLMGYSDDLHLSSLNPLSSKTGIIAFEIAEDVLSLLDELKLVFSASSESYTFILN